MCSRRAKIDGTALLIDVLVDLMDKGVSFTVGDVLRIE